MEKVNCAKCGRPSANAAVSKGRLCIGCGYLGKVTVNRVLARVAERDRERAREAEIAASRPQRRRQSSRRRASA